MKIHMCFHEMTFIFAYIFLYRLSFSRSIKLRLSRDPSIFKDHNETALMINYYNSLHDPRQKRIFENKYLDTNVQTKSRQIFNEDFFFQDYLGQLHDLSIYSKKHIKYDYFKYFPYNQIIEKLTYFASTYPENIRVTTSQKLYGLPNPIGDCGDKDCENYIVFLGNKEKFTNTTPQMYISCALHGDENVGPTLCVEFIELMLQNYSANAWVKFLLDNRLMIITPMTNAYGYYMGMREELVDYHNERGDFRIDPNRDFPILTRSNECMQTISARTINEIFLSHMIRLSISIHGGTSSLTYPYGTPSRMERLDSLYKLPVKNNSQVFLPIIEEYYKGSFDSINDRSTESPDDSMFEDISNLLSQISNANKDFQYPTGSMTNLVYQVRGGFEDWAYSGAWEGLPTITQPCTPLTYTQYPSNKTSYDKNNINSIKSVSLLLETSESKSPQEANLGIKKPECFLNITSNPFQPEIDEFIQKDCLGSTYNGYISKNLRLLLIAADLVQPYCNIIFSNFRAKWEMNYLSLEWIIGGASIVDETFVLYNFDSARNFEQEIDILKETGFKDLNVTNFNCTKKQGGNGIWNVQRKKRSTRFQEIISIPKEFGKIEYVVLFKVDQHWNTQHSPDPLLSPRTHLANERTNKDYYVKNNNYLIHGVNYFNTQTQVKKLKIK